MFKTRILSSLFLFLFLYISTLSTFLYLLIIIHLISFLVCFEYLRIINFSGVKKRSVSQYYNNLLLTRMRLLKIDIFLIVFIQGSFTLFYNNYISITFLLLIPILIGISGVIRHKFFEYLFLIYWILPFYFLIFIFHQDQTFYFLTLFLVITISTDVGAYIFGKTLKGPKILKNISPNKTWSGFVGANLLTILGVSTFFSSSIIDVGFVFILIIFSVICQTGDFLESYLKRCFNIKNSSNLIPGHGGILDRIDGLTLLINAIFLLYVFKFDFMSIFIL